MDVKMASIYFRAALAALFGGWASCALAIDARDISVDGDVTGVWDDNQSQAQYERDQVEDRAVIVGGRVGVSHETGSHSLLQGTLFLEFEDVVKIDALNRGSAGLKGAWRWQPSSAFTAPVVEFNLSYQEDNYNEDARDSGVITSQLFVTRRLTDRITATLGAQYRSRDSDGSVWDLEDYRGFINVDYLLKSSLALYATYSHTTGDSFSSAQRTYCSGAPATTILPLINAATAIEPDGAYNDSLCGDWVAYRIDARTDAAVVGVNYAISHETSLDFSVLDVHVEEKNDDNIYYDRTLIRVSLLKRF